MSPDRPAAPSRYAHVYQRAQEHPQDFWAEAAEALTWDKRWDRVLDDDRAPFVSWFAGAQMNVCYNALDRHVENGRADQNALIYDSPVTNTVRAYTYKELRDEVARFAGVLRALGMTTGDRAVIYMPMVPEAAVAMLACARIGVIHSVVFGGFAPRELATRLDDVGAKMVITASCGIEINRVIAYKPLLDEAIEISEGTVTQCIVLQRPQVQASMIDGRDVEWTAMMADAQPADCVSLPADHPLYVLYTSGTTGKPKGVVRTGGPYAVALAWSMKNIYGVDPGDAFWAASDVGWVVGHSYIVYGPLLHGCTSILYEGKPIKTPDAGAFWRVIADHKVRVMFTAPTAFRAIRREDPEAELMHQYDLSHFRTLFLAGERCDPDTLHWAEQQLGVKVVDHWWQTETGWPMTCVPMGVEDMPVKAGSAGPTVPGYEIHVVNDEGAQLEAGQIGNIVVKLPLPPGCLPTLWQNDEGFVNSYLSTFDGYYLTGDAGIKDEDGYLWIMSRIDDIINVAGHRLSTGGMEEVLAAHEDVAECAVIGPHDKLKGEVPLGFVVLKSGVTHEHADVVKDLVQLVREKIGAVACFKQAVVVERLPKTRSGKILRGTMKKIADGQSWKMPATIDDPVILDEITEALKSLGYPKQG